MVTVRTQIADTDGSTLGFVASARNAFGKAVLYAYWTLDPSRPPQQIKERRWGREFIGVEDATRYMRAWAGEVRRRAA